MIIMIGAFHIRSIFMRIVVLFISLVLALPALGPAFAHEYWIEPKTYRFAPEERLAAGLFNGQNFSGGEFAYFDKNFRRFDLALGERVATVEGRLGDKPALNVPALGEGLNVAIYESAGDTVFYSDFTLFEKFVTHKDFKTALARHAERSLPQKDFFEFYTRHAKLLLAVGNGAGADRAYGLETEIVALKNPYTDDVAGGLPVKVLYRGAPRADVQVELFDKDQAGQVKISLVRTDAGGVALLPVVSGHSYLVDAVVLREPEEGSKAMARKAVWESLWAALTFAVP
jgi:uncharacterized GH25 family protein